MTIWSWGLSLIDIDMSKNFSFDIYNNIDIDIDNNINIDNDVDAI